MDLNPDEAIAAGWLREDSPRGCCNGCRVTVSGTRKKSSLWTGSWGRASKPKKIAPDKIAVIPPWSHDDAVGFDAEGREAFRRAHGLADKFVVMYSGNHSPCHPLDTLLDAARRLAHRKDIVFCFVGGGSEWRKIKEKVESRKQKAEIAERGGEFRKRRPKRNPPCREHPTSNSQVSTFNFTINTFSVSIGWEFQVNLNPTGPSHQRSSISNLPSTGQPSTDAPSTDPLLPAPCSLLPNVRCLPYQPLSQLSASLFRLPMCM